jgi:hypothetical protein
MRMTVRLLGLVAGSLLVVSAAVGQTTAPSIAPAAGDVLARVPDGCLAFVLVKNVKDLGGRVDAFLKAVSPGQALTTRPVLEELKSELNIADGLRFEGGLAAVVMDPGKYGVDLAARIKGKMAGSQPSSDQPGMPVASIVPTNDLAKLLAGYNPTKTGDYYVFTPGPGSRRYAKQAGGFAVIGPNLKVVQDIAASTKDVTGKLSAADKDMLAANNIVAWVDVKSALPIVESVLDSLTKQGPGEDIAMMQAQLGSMQTQFAALKEYAKQVDHVMLGARITDTAVIVDGRVALVPDSVLGKALAEYKPLKTESLLDRLPEMGYVFAIGQRELKLPPAEIRKSVQTALEVPPYKGLPDEQKKKLLEAMVTYRQQLNQTQVYLGGNTTGEGVMGISVVLDVVSSEKARDSIVSMVEVASDALQGATGPFQGLTVTYAKNALTVDGKNVDTITLEHPMMASMPPEAHDIMKSILGQTQVQACVVPVDETTLVVTFGGGGKFLGEALKVAKGGGKLPAQPEAAKMLDLLPKDRMAVMLISPSNLVTAIKNGMALIEPNAPIKLNMPSAPPVAGAGYIDRKDACFSLVVPTETVREIVKLFKSLASGRQDGEDGGLTAPIISPEVVPN